MKWKRSSNGLLFLQTALGPFYIGVNYCNGLSFYVRPPSRIVWNEEFSTVKAAKRAIEQHAATIAAELSEGINE